MTISNQFIKASQIIQSKTSLISDTLLILGSGLGDFTNKLQNSVVISYQDIPYFYTGNIAGHAGELHIGYLNNKVIYCMKGRSHYYEGVSDETIRFPIQLFSYLGVKNLIVTNACGGMNPSFEVGNLMVIEDHINMMGRNPLTGLNVDELGPRFSDMSDPYDKEFIKTIFEIGAQEKINLKKGVYVGYMGPSYETKAEIKAYTLLGGDAVGMSTVPEVIVAAHSGMKTLGISVITNMSTGIQKEKLSHEEVIRTGKKVQNKLSVLLEKFIEKL